MSHSIRKIGTNLSILLLTLTVSGCGWFGHKSKPTVNPHPHYFVTITGNIQPRMPYPMTMIFKATYAAYHPDCGVWISRFEGVKGLAGHSVYYPVKPNAKGDYTVKIPIDGYLPGKCDWKIAWVNFSMVRKIPPANQFNDLDNEGTLIHFGRKGNPDELPGYPMTVKASLSCGVGGLEKCTGETLQGWYVNFVSRKKSYHFIQNIKNRG